MILRSRSLNKPPGNARLPLELLLNHVFNCSGLFSVQRSYPLMPLSIILELFQDFGSGLELVL